MLSRTGILAAVPAVMASYRDSNALFQPAPNRPATLGYLFGRVKLCLVPFNAQDIYQVCTVALNNDSIGMMQDPDFMRGIADAFAVSNQTVLSPFQTNLISDTLRRVGINTSPTEVMVPTEEDAISSESLLGVLVAMNVTRARDEKKLEEVIQRMTLILDEFTPTQLSQALIELGRIRCSNADIMARLAKRFLAVADQLSAMDISLVARYLGQSRGVPHLVLRRVFLLVEERVDEFQPEDYLNCLQGLFVAGGQYMRTFTRLVEAGLEHVESMDAVTLTHYLACFTELEYRRRDHVEIYADALVDVAMELGERELVQAFIALKRLNLLGEDMFTTITNCLVRMANMMDPRNIAAVMDVCSTTPFSSDELMHALLDRAYECTRVLPPYQLAEILDCIALYPPAREHPIVSAFGKQAKLRVEIMGPEPLALTTSGLARLGFNDPDFYMLAAHTGFRYGFKDWSQLEPILMGMCLSEAVPITMVKVVCSHLAPMCKSMNMNDIERANRYMLKLRCEDEYVFRALAGRVMSFVKEITPDMPEELQTLIQRGAISRRNDG